MLKTESITLRMQLFSGYFLILLAILILSGITYSNINKSIATAILTKHTLEVVAVGHVLEKQLLNMETGQRGYLITGKLNFLIPFEQGKNKFYENYNIALELVSDNHQQVKLLTQIGALESQWLEQALQYEISERDKVNQGLTTMKDISTLVANETGKQLMDKLRVKLKKFIYEENKLLHTRELQQQNDDESLLNQIIIGTILALLMGIIFIYITIHFITKPINEMTTLAIKIAAGDLSQKIEQPGSDEIGDLARSINMMVDTLNDISDQANAIAHGDFSVEIIQKNDTDRLGIALNGMKSQVKERTEAMEESERKMQRANDNLLLQNKLKSQISEITELTQGATDLIAISDDIISALAKMTEAGHGALYIIEQDDKDNRSQTTLLLKGTYAFDKRKNNLNRIGLGEGLVGQCAKEKEQIMITNAPADYIQIHSGLGEKNPLNIIATPILFEQKLMGVIELASFSKFSNMQVEMLKQVSTNISSVFNNIHNLIQTQNLLQETQSQSEELLAQQNELRISNESLRKQTQVLNKPTNS